jgi:hypothetical protein
MFALSAVLAGSAPISAQQSLATVQPGDTRPNEQKTPPSLFTIQPAKPFPSLFGNRPKVMLFAALSRSQQHDELGSQPPRVVCGMTLVPADPRFDARIRRRTPADGRTFAIDAVDGGRGSAVVVPIRW